MTEVPKRTKNPGALEFSGATLLVLGLTSTGAQIAAAAALGVLEHLPEMASTGGVLALVGSIFMGIRCRSWAFWKKWIWAWAGAMVVLAFVATNLNFQLTERARNQACDETRAQLDAQAAQVADLQATAEANVAEELRRIAEASVPGGNGYFSGLYEREVEGRVAEWSAEKYEQQYGFLGGQEAEQEYDALYAEYMESC